MTQKPQISHDELVEFLKQRIGRVSIDRLAVSQKIKRTPEGLASLRLDALIGDTAMRVVADVAYQELRERIGAPPEDGVTFLD